MGGNMHMGMLLMMLITSWMIWTADGAADVSFSTKGATAETYNYFIKVVRDKLASGKVSHEFQRLRSKSDIPNDRQRFLLVKLSSSTDESITLALDVVTARLVAYQATDSQSFFFKDAPRPQSNILFPNTNQNNFLFTGSYADLTQTAEANRAAIPLGITRLSTAIQDLHAWSTGPQVTLARALLVVIQIVPDAAKISYIQRMVANNGVGTAEFVPDCSSLSYEDNWVSLSTAILTADANGGFQSPVVLKRGSGVICKNYEVDEVTPNLRNDLALLLSNLAISPYSPVIKSVVAAQDEENINALIMAVRKFNPGRHNK